MSPYTEDTLKQLIWQRRLFLVINCVAALSMGILFYFVHNQNLKIQQERRDSIRRSCVSQNDRHDNTIALVNNLVKSAPKGTKTQLRATILFIDALVPKQNCELLVDQSVHS